MSFLPKPNLSCNKWQQYALGVAILLLSFNTGYSATINVPADQATIQAGVNAAAAGDIVLVANGTYNESINLNAAAAGIQIVAATTGSATINGGGAAAIFATNHTGAITIKGFTLMTSLNASTSGAISMTNLTGQLTVRDNSINSGGNTCGVWVLNSGTMPTNVSVLNNVFSGMGNDDCIHIAAGQNNVGGAANILIDGNSNTGTLQDPAIFLEMEGNTTATVIVTNNNFSNWSASGEGMRLRVGTGSPISSNLVVHFLIDNNSFTNTYNNSIFIDMDGSLGKIYGTISNNTVSGNPAGSAVLSGIYLDSDSTIDGVESTINISGNNISSISDDGIRVRPFADDPNPIIWNLVIDNNTISSPEIGIHIDEGSGVDDEKYTINAEITNNTITAATIACIRIARPTTTLVGTAVVNYEESGNTGCTPVLVGTPTAAVDPVPNTLDMLKIGNLIWDDANKNGIFDGEAGIEGVVINFSGNGFSGSTITNAMGIYQLPALTPGTYTLTLILPPTHQFITTKNQGVNTNIDSDFVQATGVATVTLVGGAGDDLGIDGGLATSVVLPITLGDFEGEMIRKSNKLTWWTATELNSSHFDVEQSTDGQSFTSLGRVEAGGHSFAALNYEFSHDNPRATTNYYRLKMVDLDGTYKYSKMINLKSFQGGNVSIAPNPAHDFIQIGMENALDEDLRFEIYTSTGMKIKEGIMASSNDIIDIREFPSGLYILMLNNGEMDKSYKFIKK